MKNYLVIMAALLMGTATVNAQETGGYHFQTVVSQKATPVKNQASTGTCWCFATVSFLESELLRQGKGEYDLSEMFIVRQKYLNQIKNNFLRHGESGVGQGSLSHTALNVIRQVGIVPEEAYHGIAYNSDRHNHKELNSYLGALAQAEVKLKQHSPEFDKMVNGVLDTYLGPVPEKFTYKGKEYTPITFANSLGLNLDDYVELTSFTHHPFYQKMMVEVHDNWENAEQYNLPLDELMSVMDYALNNGYTIDWDGDVSEKGFSHANGVAINPQVEDLGDYSSTDRARFEAMPANDRLTEIYKFEQPYPEVKVTQEVRQNGFETYVTTDDHLMHITGISKDQNGNKYYITKNSWGTERNKNGGYLNMSDSYVRAKTIYIMVHKDAVPKELRQKLGF